jgi:hypothetical protein
MPRGIEGNEIASSTKKATPRASSQASAAKGQKTLLGFFQRTPGPPSFKKETSESFSTPAPSSDPIFQSSPPGSSTLTVADGKNKENGLLTPATQASVSNTDGLTAEVEGVASSPTRKVVWFDPHMSGRWWLTTTVVQEASQLYSF